MSAFELEGVLRRAVEHILAHDAGVDGAAASSSSSSSADVAASATASAAASPSSSGVVRLSARTRRRWEALLRGASAYKSLLDDEAAKTSAAGAASAAASSGRGGGAASVPSTGMLHPGREERRRMEAHRRQHLNVETSIAAQLLGLVPPSSSSSSSASSSSSSSSSSGSSAEETDDQAEEDPKKASGDDEVPVGGGGGGGGEVLSTAAVPAALPLGDVMRLAEQLAVVEPPLPELSGNDGDVPAPKDQAAVLRMLLPLCKEADASLVAAQGVLGTLPEAETPKERRLRELRVEEENRAYRRIVANVDAQHQHETRGLGKIGIELANMNHVLSMAVNLLITCGSVFAAGHFITSRTMGEEEAADSVKPLVVGTTCAVAILLVETWLYMIRGNVLEERIPTDVDADRRARGTRLSVLNAELGGEAARAAGPRKSHAVPGPKSRRKKTQ